MVSQLLVMPFCIHVRFQLHYFSYNRSYVCNTNLGLHGEQATDCEVYVGDGIKWTNATINHFSQQFCHVSRLTLKVFLLNE